jgi:hypothetical protein
MLGDFEWDGQSQVEPQADNDPGEEIPDDFQDSDSADSDVEDMDDEKCMPSTLWIPSTFGRDFCFKNGWGKIVDQEIQLRMAQAEESLEELRLAIGHKSLLYKICIRKSKTQASQTRSRAQLIQVNDRIKECAGRYRCARSALLSLGAPADTLDKFQALCDLDLKVNTDVAEENRIGQRNDTLPWFWRIGRGESTKNPWMNESMCIVHFPICV